MRIKTSSPPSDPPNCDYEFHKHPFSDRPGAVLASDKGPHFEWYQSFPPALNYKSIYDYQDADLFRAEIRPRNSPYPSKIKARIR